MTEDTLIKEHLIKAFYGGQFQADLRQEKKSRRAGALAVRREPCGPSGHLLTQSHLFHGVSKFPVGAQVEEAAWLVLCPSIST